MSDTITTDDLIDLGWLFNEAAGELVPSSPGFEGSGDQHCATSESAEDRAERAMAASMRMMRMNAIVNKLSKRQQLALYHAFKRAPFPKELVRERVQKLFYEACSSSAMRAFLAELGAAQWSAKASCEWLVRAETPKNGMGVEVERLVALRDACWGEAEESFTAVLADFAKERHRYDALPSTKRRKRVFCGERWS
jgi:hypothetical protein